jgi:peptidyl-prolyl cis-trans isomerase SurA
LGEIEANVLDNDIRIVASKLSPGATSDPFEFSDGIYIIHLISRRKFSESMAEQETMTLAQAVARIPKNSSVDDISARLKKTVEDTNDCNAFDAAAKRFSPTQPARIVDVNINDLPEFVRKYVNGMSVGQQTPALSINGGVVILMVCERKMLEPQFQSEETITDSLQLERIERQAETYLRDLRRLALIEINR